MATLCAIEPEPDSTRGVPSERVNLPGSVPGTSASRSRAPTSASQSRPPHELQVETKSAASFSCGVAGRRGRVRGRAQVSLPPRGRTRAPSPLARGRWAAKRTNRPRARGRARARARARACLDRGDDLGGPAGAKGRRADSSRIGHGVAWVKVRPPERGQFHPCRICPRSPASRHQRRASSAPPAPAPASRSCGSSPWCGLRAGRDAPRPPSTHLPGRIDSAPVGARDRGAGLHRTATATPTSSAGYRLAIVGWRCGAIRIRESAKTHTAASHRSGETAAASGRLTIQKATGNDDDRHVRPRTARAARETRHAHAVLAHDLSGGGVNARRSNRFLRNIVILTARREYPCGGIDLRWLANRQSKICVVRGCYAGSRAAASRSRRVLRSSRRLNRTGMWRRARRHRCNADARSWLPNRRNRPAADVG